MHYVRNFMMLNYRTLNLGSDVVLYEVHVIERDSPVVTRKC